MAFRYILTVQNDIGLEHSEDQLKPLVPQLPPDPPELSRWPSASVMSEGLGRDFSFFFRIDFGLNIGGDPQIGYFRGRMTMNQQIWGVSNFQTNVFACVNYIVGYGVAIPNGDCQQV